jgi:S-adenosylmethionine:tRNA ribosyltransferase-isomerase
MAYSRRAHQMRLSDFSFDLPADRIAQRPLQRRDESRMMILSRSTQCSGPSFGARGNQIKPTPAWEDSAFQELPDLLTGNELIVVNNARVIPARLFGRREGIRAEKPGRNRRAAREFLSAPIEILLTKRLSTDEWEALVRPGRKIRVGERIEVGDGDLFAEVTGRSDYGLRRLRLMANGDVNQAIERLGHVPLPPYISREDEPADRDRYQTIFADHPGAVAAPTAGLHFSAAIIERLRQRGVEMATITLDVGLGTFQPIHEEEIERHKIHSERYDIPAASAIAICEARRAGRPILAIGTTVVRALEDAAAKAAEKHGEGPGSAKCLVEACSSEASMFIKPGHTFRVVDQLLTNFHLPQSSLLILVSAFAGREFILRAYRHAVEADYRFYSYGDCMWIR